MAFSPRSFLSNVGLTDGGAFNRRAEADVGIRAYPFPYIAAFSISNDCDSMSRAAFEDWHAFVNGKGTTPNGDGLGLEIDDSFWIWGGHRNFAIHRHFPEVEPRVDSDDLGRIVELGRLGWLGTLHSMGNWRLGSQRGSALHAHRSQAQYALDRLDSLGIKVTTYVNHSGSVSNVGGPWGWYQKSDEPGHPFYCLDLMRAYGLRFFWVDGCINFEKFGDHLEYESMAKLQQEIRRFRWAHWLRKRIGNAGDIVEPISLPDDEVERRRLLMSFFNRTLIQVKARDGSQMWAFKRHRGTEQPIMSTFCTQVTEDDLDALEKRRGTAIVYQHFGLTGPRGRSPVMSKPHRTVNTSPTFDEHARARLASVAQRFHAGRLWVATTSRLLRYLWLREVLRYSVTRTRDKWHVVIGQETSDTSAGRLSGADLNGLSLVVPSTAPMVIVSFGDQRAPLPVRRVPDTIYSDLDVVYLPWTPLEWPG